MRYSLIIFYVFIFFKINAQNKSGHQWILNDHIIIDFRGQDIKIDTVSPPPFDDGGSHSSNVCDSVTGNILYQSGGCYISNKLYKIMKNGDSINSRFPYIGGWCKVSEGDGDLPVQQNNISIEYPENPNKYLLVNCDMDTILPRRLRVAPVAQYLYAQMIDMSKDNGLGEVIEKKKIAIKDTLARGFVVATRHTNDKDWWVIVPKYFSDCFFVMPITKDGVGEAKKYCLGIKWQEIDLGGLVSVSPDGKKYARVSNRDSIALYDFNPTTGVLSNPLLFKHKDTVSYLSGVCFSQNSRYLYVTHRYKVYQFDLKAAKI